jgi:FlaA1/EpsC-like NDP-sugar epimerase
MERKGMNLHGKRILVTGGTGSLGQALVRRLLGGELGRPEFVEVFSRDEAKQYFMRLDYLQRAAATDDILYRNSQELLRFRIGDVRDYASVAAAVRGVDVVFNTAALKQVPACEYAPYQAALTNIAGPENIIRAIREKETPIDLVVGVSTDKACKPVNVMGMTKAIQERLFVQANMQCPRTRFVCVRYGNVISSRGSVVPLFLEQIRTGGPITITMKEMTRFLLSLEEAVDTILAAARDARSGETYIPRVPAARVIDIAEALRDGRDIPLVFTGIRPGEKLHEVLVSEEERFRTIERGEYYVILPVLPELRHEIIVDPVLPDEYSSRDTTLDLHGVRQLVAPYVQEPPIRSLA